MSQILLVNDSRRLNRVRAQLEAQVPHWTLTFAPQPADALRLLEEQSFDAVVADLHLPGRNPWELLKEVVRRRPDAARIVMAADPEEGDMLPIVTFAHQFVARGREATHLMAAVERAVRLRDLLGPDEASRHKPLESLPSLPSTVSELLSLLEDPDAGPREVAAVVERDMALSAKVLQTVNSAYFAGRSQTTTVEAATIRLGVSTIRSLVLLDEVVQSVKLPSELERQWLTRLNTYALETARLAKRLAPPALRDQAFCAGLLHECGQLIFAAARPEVFSLHLRRQEEESRSLSELEREAFGCSHSQAGAHLLEQWGFPPELTGAALTHEQPVAAEGGALWSLVGIVRLAHQLVEGERRPICSAGHDHAADGAQPDLPDADLSRLGVLEEVTAWRSEIATEPTADAA